MKHFKFLLLAILMVLPLSLLAQETGADVTNPADAVALLTPFIVFAAIQVFKLVKPILPAWILGILVPGLSALAVYLTNLLGAPDVSWIAQFGLGLAATFVHQVIKQLTSST